MFFEIRRVRLASFLAAVAWLGGSPTAAQPPDRVRAETPTATAQRTTGTIHIDGRLDEPDWEKAPAIGPLTQREPLEGREATERTDVRILFWGFNVERQIKHLFETDRWAAARVTSWIGNLADAGQLTGLDGARQGHGLDVRPYVSGGRDTGDGQFTSGLDVYDNASRLLGVQSRFRWILKPGNDVVVFG
ncbi:MAG: hypothetical protein HY047_13605 [Acidobacteria bacterium]|nr:hypothetical protein [Acidobacteriota bacterium]